jgi:hypothetical protein
LIFMIRKKWRENRYFVILGALPLSSIFWRRRLPSALCSLCPAKKGTDDGQSGFF